jgi:hypothetical protein
MMYALCITLLMAAGSVHANEIVYIRHALYCSIRSLHTIIVLCPIVYTHNMCIKHCKYVAYHVYTVFTAIGVLTSTV